MSPAPRPPAREARPGRGRSADSRPAARGSAAVRRALRGESVQHEPFLAFERTNYLLMAAGLGLAVVGFALLHAGDVSLAPFLLVVGYCGFIPAGILWRRRRGPGEARGAGDGRAGE